jgi:hypothetical protein
MATFTISLWVTVDAEDQGEAYRVASKITEELDVFGDVGVIDIEEQDTVDE